MTEERRLFLKRAAWLPVVSPAIPSLLASCTQSSKSEATEEKVIPVDPSLKLSLAQWSLHRTIEEGLLDPEDFPFTAKSDFGFSAVEYVNGFYLQQAENTVFWENMAKQTRDVGITNLLIMVDDEGDLGNPDPEARKSAVVNHFKWVDAAAILGCHSIRVNAFGEGEKEEVQAAMINGLRALCLYAQSKGINILIENHGLYSSDPVWVSGVITRVDMDNAGTLPDFGNWCMGAKWGSTQNEDCDLLTDHYEGVSGLLPFAKGVSAKSYNFNDDGEHLMIDYNKMLSIVKSSGFDGYIGIEYEGKLLNESEGIKATRALIEKIWTSLA